MATIDNEAVEWVVRQSHQPLNDAEQHTFDAWFEADIRHQGAYLRATALQNAVEKATLGKPMRPRREWLSTERRPEVPLHLAARRAFMRYGGALAACAVLAVALLATHSPEATVLATAHGELRVVPLGDQSVASINSSSRIEVSLTARARNVAVQEGEAFFEVAKDKARPFLVSAGGVRVRAVGTAFGVRRLAHGAEILVTEGTVDVWNADRSSQVRRVTAGERALVAGPAQAIVVTRQPGETQRKLAWREGRLIFADQKLGDAVADFNRYSVRQIVIVDPSLTAKSIIGQYPIDSPEIFARDIGAYLNVPISITSEKIEIGGAPDKLGDERKRKAKEG